MSKTLNSIVIICTCHQILSTDRGFLNDQPLSLWFKIFHMCLSYQTSKPDIVILSLPPLLCPFISGYHCTEHGLMLIEWRSNLLLLACVFYIGKPRPGKTCGGKYLPLHCSLFFSSVKS